MPGLAVPAAGDRKMRFSVCIPTFRRPRELLRALAGFQNQTYRHPFEIIVCDNDTDRGIENRINEFNGSAKVPARYLSQGGGIQEVRSRLANEARGDLILMIDDDESACPELLDVYARLFSENEDLAAAGGPCKVVWVDAPPAWIRDYVDQRRETNLWGRFEPCAETRIGVGVNVWEGIWSCGDPFLISPDSGRISLKGGIWGTEKAACSPIWQEGD